MGGHQRLQGQPEHQWVSHGISPFPTIRPPFAEALFSRKSTRPRSTSAAESGKLRDELSYTKQLLSERDRELTRALSRVAQLEESGREREIRLRHLQSDLVSMQNALSASENSARALGEQTQRMEKEKQKRLEQVDQAYKSELASLRAELKTAETQRARAEEGHRRHTNDLESRLLSLTRESGEATTAAQHRDTLAEEVASLKREKLELQERLRAVEWDSAQAVQERDETVAQLETERREKQAGISAVVADAQDKVEQLLAELNAAETAQDQAEQAQAAALASVEEACQSAVAKAQAELEVGTACVIRCFNVAFCGCCGVS